MIWRIKKQCLRNHIGKVQQPDPKENGNEREQEKTWSLRRVKPNSSSNKESDSKQQQSLKKNKGQNKREQAQINRSLSVERQPLKNVSQSSYRIASSDTPTTSL